MIDYSHLFTWGPSIGRGVSLHAEKRSHGKAWKPAQLTDEEQEKIDACLEHCPWPENPGMCGQCNGRPERVKRAKKRSWKDKPEHTERIRINHEMRAAVLWLEWRSRQPDNPDPKRTREILRGVRG